MQAKVIRLPYPVTGTKAAVYHSPCIHAVMCMTHRTPDHGTTAENWRMLMAYPTAERAAARAARIARHA